MARILVVDDDADILKMAEQILGSAGHSVITAEDAVRAIELLNQIEFDLLLSDANMPMYSGFELISTVRKETRFKNLGIAMLTGLRERKDVEHAVKLGVDDYIVKPLDPLILIQKINSLFDKKPPQTYPEISLRDSPLAKGVVQREVVVESVSELGIRVLTSMPLLPGAVVDIQADFFRELDMPPPPMKVLSVETDKDTGQCRGHLIFLGAREAFLQKIRRWLYSHASINKMMM